MLRRLKAPTVGKIVLNRSFISINSLIPCVFAWPESEIIFHAKVSARRFADYYCVATPTNHSITLSQILYKISTVFQYNCKNKQTCSYTLMIIHRAFIREVLQTCVAVAAILFSIFLVTRLVEFLSRAAQGDVPIDSVFLLLTLKMVANLDIILPLVIYISILLVMGRWIRDNELTVISASGISMTAFIKPMLVLFAVTGTMVATFSLYISPLSEEAFQSIQQQHRNRSEVAGIVSGVFTETRGGTGVYFVESYDRQTNTYHDIFVYTASAGDDGVMLAARGYKTTDAKTADDFLILNKGIQYRGNAGSAEYTVVDFATYALRLTQPALTNSILPLDARSTQSLLANANISSISELHWRFSKIMMLPVLMLFALSFSSVGYRKNRFPGMLVALLIYFAYSHALGFVMAMIRKGLVHPHFSLWVVHIIFLCLAFYLFQRRTRNLRLIPELPS